MWPVMGSGTNAAKLSIPICIFLFLLIDCLLEVDAKGGDSIWTADLHENETTRIQTQVQRQRRNVGSLHCAVHDETVNSLGRDDEVFAVWKMAMTTEGIKAQQIPCGNDNKKDRDKCNCNCKGKNAVASGIDRGVFGG
jgi:hypothetical protein